MNTQSGPKPGVDEDDEDEVEPLQTLKQKWTKEVTCPEGTSMTGECRTITEAKMWELIRDTAPLPPRDLFYYDKQGQLAHTFSFSVKDMKAKDKIYTKVGDTNYECIVTKSLRCKINTRASAVNAVDQYFRNFRMADSGQVFLNLLAAITNKPAFYNSCHAWFHTCGPDHEEWNDLDRMTIMLKPDWFPDRIGLLGALARCCLNGFAIFAVAIELVFSSQDEFERKLGNSLYFWCGLSISFIEVYLYLHELFHVIHDSVSLLRRLIQGDTVHFQCRNVATHLDRLALVSIFNFLPSSELLARSIRRKYELLNTWCADIDFETRMRSRDCPWVIAFREYWEGVLYFIAPPIALFAVLFRVADSLPFLVQKNATDWSFYQWGLYLGFVNQMAGLRNIRDIETQSIQHFIFSGQNSVMDIEESLMMHTWTSYVLVSAVASASKYFAWPVIDSICFWYMLTPVKVQLLVKNHSEEGSEYVTVDTDKYGRYRLKPANGYRPRPIDTRASAGRESHLGFIALSNIGLHKDPNLGKMDTVELQEMEVAIQTAKNTVMNSVQGHELGNEEELNAQDDGVELVVSQAQDLGGRVPSVQEMQQVISNSHYEESESDDEGEFEISVDPPTQEEHPKSE